MTAVDHSQTQRMDRQSPVPLYFQLARLLTHEISIGRWSPGERLASESEICAAYGVSRATVRQALQRLENESLIQRFKGRGTFVAEPRDRSWLLQSPEGVFHDEGGRFGVNVTSTVLRAETAELPQWASEALELPDGSSGVILERLRYIDGKVMLHVSDYLPPEYAKAALSLKQRDGSLYDRLALEQNVTVGGGRRILEATRAEARIAKLLEVGQRAPLMLIESVSWDADLKPFHCYHSWLRTDRIPIEIQVSRPPSHG